MLNVRNVFLLLLVGGGTVFIQGFPMVSLPAGRCRCGRQYSSLNLFGGLDYEAVESFLDKALFSYDDKQQNNNDDDPQKQFIAFADLEEKYCDTPSDMKQLETARKSLLHFLQLWARQLQDDPKAQGLTTPIMAQDFRRINITDTTDNNSPDTESADNYYHSMKLIFRPPKRYLSYKEQRGMEKGVIPDRKGAKVDAWSPGGVELMVGMNIVVDRDNDDNNDMISNNDNLWRLQLVARRCAIDGDTVIKYESERAILRRLQEAIRIWRKVRAMK